MTKTNDHTTPLWIFGYGSLVWDPGFTPAEAVPARLDGWHRSFCMRSIHFRGTVEKPGLVLALDAQPGAHCWGVALRVAEEDREAVLAETRARELVSDAYLEKRLPVTLQDGREVETVTYVIDRAGPQYCQIGAEEQAQIIATAVGGRGPNRDYLFNTAAHLAEWGLEDEDLVALATRVRALIG
ncbi:cation transport protein ChaC [Rhodobacter aestuarii]|uniref:glutathione-specific gamma-glutamylcyclotransferase n=1 Tax=Rhodobacter aestuarii TaxID=453582 RepID=A0A1N7L4D8_9RHOB|nr:gamma-glutamylcyclotransferase [Rhodobacter aestuarii]PTV95389.1 cation transport protein ChaC [Rhodobacter aestuarii]SIS68684.1 cation transport protein ChaC [Rhodobacter aestuarii]